MFNRLLGFSGWMLLGAAVGVGSTQGVNILLNIFYGVAVNAAVGISNQVNSAVNQFVSNFQTAFMPQIIKLYAAGDMEQLQKLIDRSSRFSFILLFAIACPLMLNINFVLKLWLKNVPEYAPAFCILILIYSLIEAVSKPIGFAIHATGNVKYYNIIMSVALSMNIIFSFLFLMWGFSPIVVLVIYILVSICCFIIRLLLAKRYNVLKIKSFVNSVVLRVIIITVCVLPFSIYISSCFDQWSALLITILTFIPIYIIVTYYCGFTGSERVRVRKIMIDKIFLLRK